jgi:ABC-type multidrug transport system fused ATPase/permease subunit
VKAVFPETSINAQLADQIALDTGATAKYRLYGDTLGPEGVVTGGLRLDGARERRRDGARHDRRPRALQMTSLLRVEGLAAGYGGPPVVDGVTFDLRAGERIGVLGPNGGGKST